MYKLSKNLYLVCVMCFYRCFMLYIVFILSPYSRRNIYSINNIQSRSFFIFVLISTMFLPIKLPFNQLLKTTKNTRNPYATRLPACYLITIVSSTSPFNIKFHIQFQTQKNHLLFPYIIRNLMPSKKKISSLIVIQAKKMEHFLLPCLPVNHFQHVYYNEPFLLYRYIHHDYCCIYLKA